MQDQAIEYYAARDGVREEEMRDHILEKGFYHKM